MNPLFVEEEIQNAKTVEPSTSAEAPKLLAPIPMSIICPTCKQETGFTKEDIMNMTISENICCPNCDSVIYSCCPERNIWTSTGYNHSNSDEFFNY